jgi:hypothetical protein
MLFLMTNISHAYNFFGQQYLLNKPSGQLTVQTIRIIESRILKSEQHCWC